MAAKTDSSKKSGKDLKRLEEVDNNVREDIREAFELVDTNKTGFMETKQLKFAVRALGFEPRKNDIKKLVVELDKEGTGQISFKDFAVAMSKRIAEKDADEEIMKAFELFDEDKTGKITFNNLKKVAKELGENLMDEDLMEMITEADRDGDGQVSREEFLRIMKKTCLY